MISYRQNGDGMEATDEAQMDLLNCRENNQVCKVVKQPKLYSELLKTRAELDQQIKVNFDLKKLLVASVGDDLHHKVDALVRTKTELASEIGNYSQKLKQEWETLDELTIQADKWRTKCMAMRLISDQIRKENIQISNEHQNSIAALEELLMERGQLHEYMTNTCRCLQSILHTFDPITVCYPVLSALDTLELAKTCHALTDCVKRKLPGLSSTGYFPTNNSSYFSTTLPMHSSHAEKLAYKVLSDHNSLKVRSPSPQFFRFHLYSSHDEISFTGCGRCKGVVQVV